MLYNTEEEGGQATTPALLTFLFIKVYKGGGGGGEAALRHLDVSRVAATTTDIFNYEMKVDSNMIYIHELH